MPAAAVIPAPIAYINVVVVKKLVVEPGPCVRRSASPRALAWPGLSPGDPHALNWACVEPGRLL